MVTLCLDHSFLRVGTGLTPGCVPTASTVSRKQQTFRRHLMNKLIFTFPEINPNPHTSTYTITVPIFMSALRQG